MTKALIASRFAQATHSYDDHAIVQRQVASDLLHLIQQHLPARNINRVFEIGCGSGIFTKSFLANFAIETLYLNDLYAEVTAHLPNAKRVQWYIGDIEDIAMPQELDLVTSSSALQWINNPARLFKKIHDALNTSQYFCFSTYGPKNLKEIKALTGQGLRYLTPSQICDVLEQSRFEILHQSERTTHLQFDHPHDVLRHIKYTGVHATGQGFRWTRTKLEQFYKDYGQYQKPETGLYPLTYHPIYIVARKSL